jgi:glycosyltransferase involved in cell wall biosynthesis
MYGHHLELGGSQTNAIELAASLRDRHGYDVVLYASPGPAAALAEARGVRLLDAPRAGFRPSARSVRALRAAVESEQPDLVHAWDWPQVIEALLGGAAGAARPLLATSMTMVVERTLPRTVPVTFGIARLVEEARRSWRAPVDLLVPPVDTDANRPGAVDPAAFMDAHGLDPEAAQVVVVSRLTGWLKRDSIVRAVHSIDALAARGARVQLVVVGDGDAAAELADLGRSVNRRRGRPVVVLTGPLADPRPAYAAADVMLSMGGSALRSLAFAKPTVVVGSAGFSCVFDERTARWFDRNGFHGVGDGQPDTARLERQLSSLLDDPGRAAALGSFGRAHVEERYSLPAVSAVLDGICRRAAALPTSGRQRSVAAARSVAVRFASLGAQPLRREVW